MTEKHSINGRDVWLKVEPHPMHRENPNIIPTEYFTATFHWEEPLSQQSQGEAVKDEDGEVALFESPVAALTSARKKVERLTSR